MAICALRDGCSPPILNLNDPDPAGEGLDLTPLTARRRPLIAVTREDVARYAADMHVPYAPGLEALVIPGVEQIVGSYNAISIEGGFKLNNLMGVTSRTTPVSVINAVIDLDLVRGPAGHHAAGDVIELN
jgi:hypothetical protein